MTVVAWYPPDGPPLTIATHLDADMVLLGHDGTAPGAEPYGTPLVGRAGERLNGTATPARVVRARTLMYDTDDAGASRVADSMTTPAYPPGVAPPMGLLRLTTRHDATWEIAALPRPVILVRRGPSTQHLDLEWYCPNPFWRELADRTLRLTIGAGGAVLPWTLPVLLADGRQSATLDNPSPIAAALTARFVGPLTRPRLLTAGGNITVRTVAAGETVTVTTAPRATVEVVTAGVTVSGREALARLDWTDTVPFTIARSTTVELVADGGTGHVDLAWRVRRAGL